MNHPNSFPKSEHLCGEKRINKLFTTGKAFIVYPLRVVYLTQPKSKTESAIVMVGAPKKKFKRAVKRNRLKRMMREAYRLNKHSLIEALDENQLEMMVSFQYIATEILEYDLIEKKMVASIHKLIEKIV